MNVELDDFKTGWFGLSVGLKQSEIDFLVEALQHLKQNPDSHFHGHSKFEGKGGLGDIQFCSIPDDFEDNMKLDGDQ